MADKEEFYDSDIAPALAKVQKMCADAGLSFVALVAYNDNGDVGQTAAVQPNAPAVIRYANGIGNAWCEGGAVNIDSFMFAVVKEAREKGHSSAVLAQLGVPATPKS